MIDNIPVTTQDEQAIRQTIENWAVWRDAGDWERFATVWDDPGYMTATWFQGSASEFIRMSRAAFARGVRILHFLGGTSVDVRGDRAIAQTKMTITQRAALHDSVAEVVCTGRFYDFLVRRPLGWKISRRQPIYELDRLHWVDPSTARGLDEELLSRFPEGYRHLAYLQTQQGFSVKLGLPGLVGEAVDRLNAEGAAWLDGSPTHGTPL